MHRFTHPCHGLIGCGGDCDNENRRPLVYHPDSIVLPRSTHYPSGFVWGEISTFERGRGGRDVEGTKGWGVLLVWRTTLMSQ